MAEGGTAEERSHEEALSVRMCFGMRWSFMKPTGFVKETTGDAAARLESAARKTREERIMASGGGR